MLHDLLSLCETKPDFNSTLSRPFPFQVYAMLLQSLDLAQKRVRNHAASNISGLLRQGGGGDGPSGGQSVGGMNVEDVE